MRRLRYNRSMPPTAKPDVQVVVVPTVVPSHVETHEQASADRDRIGVWQLDHIKKYFKRGTVIATLTTVLAIGGGGWAALKGGYIYAQGTGAAKEAQAATNKDLYSKIVDVKTDVKSLRTDMQYGFAAAAHSLKETDDKVNDLRVSSGRIEQRIIDLARNSK